MAEDLGDFSAAWSQCCEIEREFEVEGETLSVLQDWSVGHGAPTALLVDLLTLCWHHRRDCV